jgi:glycosyltransferase involved in cell wall biosynthesis
VVYWDNIPSPYATERLNAVARRRNVDLEVWFNERGHADRSWRIDERDWEFPHRYLPGRALAIGKGLPREFNVPTPLLRRPPDLLVSLYAEPAFVLGFLLARTRGVRTAFRVLPTFDSWVRRRPAKERLKRFLFRRVDAVKVPGPDGAAYAARYGTPAERIHFVRQSVDVARFNAERTRWRADRTALRAQLGVEGCVFVYVGRLVHDKGVADLLEAFRRSCAANSDPLSLMLVGDGHQEAEYRSFCQRHGLTNALFTGFVQQDELPRLYSAADVFVFPTLGDPNGVVVEEAMASGLPIVSTSAAGDIRRRVPEGAAGFVVPPAEPAALADAMLNLARDASRRASMGARALEIVASMTHEGYADDFEAFVEDVVRSPARTRR